MTDKELLEQAAKAAGYDLSIACWTIDAFWFPENDDGEHIAWNPLTDDGDAMRLVVKLGLHIDPEDDCVDVWDGATNLCDTQYFNDDPYAATRRAIVIAAAEIGATCEK